MERHQMPSFSWVFGVAFAAAVVMLGVGVYLAAAAGEWVMLAAGSVSVVAVLVAWPIARMLETWWEASLRQRTDSALVVSKRLEEMGAVLNMMSEQQLLSDKAKSVAFREKDRDAIRRAIQEEIDAQDWEAALALANDIEMTFGYRQEAERFREEIRAKHQQVVQQRITESLNVIDGHVLHERWSEAFREAEQLARLYPQADRVKHLAQEIEGRRQEFKQRLLERWHDAVSRKDADEGISLLEQLDLYLTPAEAETMQSDAREIFKEKLHNLRDTFMSAVHDHKWRDAVRIGENIMNAFPNSRIAREVSEKIETLRQRAGTAGSASPPSPRGRAEEAAV